MHFIQLCAFAIRPLAWITTGLALQTTLGAHAQSTEPAPEPPTTWAAGLGWWRYSEPVMKLEGPQLTLRAQHTSQQAGWPDLLEADIGVGSLRYSSQGSGSLSQVPLVRGQASALWGVEPSGQWRAGLQLEATWTDLRGTTSTGHSGYERFNSKAWAVLQYEPPSTSRTELGLLLRGRQQSYLSQANPTLPDVTNTQKRGVFLAYRHSPLAGPSGGGYGLRPWIRYTSVSNSDQVGVEGWYEPRNRTLQIGLESSW